MTDIYNEKCYLPVDSANARKIVLTEELTGKLADYGGKKTTDEDDDFGWHECMNRYVVGGITLYVEYHGLYSTIFTQKDDQTKKTIESTLGIGLMELTDDRKGILENDHFLKAFKAWAESPDSQGIQIITSGRTN